MSSQLPPPFFVADSPGVDFLNSLAVPVDAEVEWLGSGVDLTAWLLQSGMISAAVEEIVVKNAMSGELDAVAAQARALREWFRKFVRAHKGKPLKARSLQELEPLNRVLARDEGFGQIAVREKVGRLGKGVEAVPGSGLQWRPQRRWRSPDSLLLPIARAMADVICDDDFTHLKACQGTTCTLMFVDRTRGHARRWCSMAICGNRAKQAAHRERASLARG
jgi:predicted RNA-binding Zn ribbon-like protein